VLVQVPGQTLAGAATIAAATTIGGLIASAIYVAISRQNDGWAIFMMMALMGSMPSSDQIALPLTDEITKRAVNLLILAMLSVAMGLCVRWLNRARRSGNEATAQSPLWDAEVDPPSPG